MLIWDMTMLAIDELLTLWGAILVACLTALYAMIWSIWGVIWTLRATMFSLIATLIFILSQAGSSAWGSGLMIYLMPVSLAILASSILALCLGGAGLIRRLR